MHFHPELGPPPTVGLEYEVTQFKGESTYLTVSEALYERGMTRKAYLRKRHEWHHAGCRDCLEIGKDLSFPVLWKLERDSSLPQDGCEFISSPFPAASMFVESAITALDQITSRAVWTNHLRKQRGEPNSEAGFHIHVHAAGLDLDGMGDFRKLMQIMHSFLPEFFMLSQSTNVERGLEFRLPSDDMANHHAWVAFPQKMGQRGIQGPANRIEWRFWEAPVDDLEYLEAAIYVSAAFTQLGYNPNMMERMAQVGIVDPWNKRNLSMDGILEEVSGPRLELLRRIILGSTHLVDDERGSQVVARLFDRVM